MNELNEELSHNEIVAWLARHLNRAPESVDLYNVGKQLYEAGSYVGAAKVLELYVGRDGSELPGKHLLGYALAMVGREDEAREHLRPCVNNGFDNDWQLLVELEVDAYVREQEAKEDGTSREQQDDQQQDT